MKYLLLVCFIFISNIYAFDKVVIWGHKLHSHTHSYIHNAFYVAFKHLGYKTYWFDNQDNIDDFDFTNTLFLTEGQVDSGMPVRNDCKYILHNCDGARYQNLDKKNYFTLQVYTDDVLPRNVHKVEACIYYDYPGRCVFMPWATDLLPHEIDEIMLKIPHIRKSSTVYWIGTIGGGYFGNEHQIDPFINACKENRCNFVRSSNVSFEENKRLVLESYMAPAIVGEWQAKVGYIPCRIFKNISYGKMGITNSKRVFELFEGKVVYNSDTYALFSDAKKRLESMKIEDLYDLMNFVKTKHTYINRIQTLLTFLQYLDENN